MDKRLTILLLVIILTCSEAMGLRVGFGQFASQAKDIDGSTGNSGLIGLTFNPSKPLLLDLSVRFNSTRETHVDFSIINPSVEILHVWRKIGYISIIVAPGLKFTLADISGFEIDLIAGGGVSFSTVFTKIEQNFSSSIPSYHLDENYEYWQKIWMIGATLKAKIYFIGIFSEVAYYDGSPLKYDPIDIEGVTILNGGETEPRGFAIYVGLSWN